MHDHCYQCGEAYQLPLVRLAHITTKVYVCDTPDPICAGLVGFSCTAAINATACNSPTDVCTSPDVAAPLIDRRLASNP